MFLTDLTLSLRLDASAIYENATLHGTKGTVTRSGDLSQSLVVSLTSSDTTECIVPEEIVIQAGASSASFIALPVNDLLLDGDQLVEVTASALLPSEVVPVQASDSLIIRDYETVTLFVPYQGRTLSYGEQTTVTLSRTNTDNDDEITVVLQATDASELLYPQTVVIPAGAASTTVDLKMIDNGLPEGDRQVFVRVLPDSRYRESTPTLIQLQETGTKTFSASVDGVAYQLDLDSEFDAIDTTSQFLRLDRTRRVILEFDSSEAAGRRVEAASLTLRPLTYPTGQIFRYNFYAYPGNSAISLSDATNTGVRVGSLTVDTSLYVPWSRHVVSLDAAAIQTIVDSSQSVGIVMALESGTSVDFYANDYSASLDEGNRPLLHLFVENNAPSFANEQYSTSILESRESGFSVGTFVATDPDVGDQLQYEIVSGNSLNAFWIHPYTGELYVSSASLIDYETSSRFILTIRATDNGRGSLHAETAVTIDLIDVPAPQVMSVWFGYGDDRWIAAEDLGTRNAPWRISKIRLMFDRHVSVDMDDLQITGEFAAYAFSSFSYDSNRFEAVWILSAPIEGDRIQAQLDGDEYLLNGDDRDADLNDGVNNDGEFLQGGDYELSFNVLIGDINNDGVVDVLDALVQRTRSGTDDLWADLNGDGKVDILDALLLRTRAGTSLPK